jgi:plastocyanin
VSLTATGGKEPVAPGSMARLLQKDKRFTPHVVAVTVGTAIEFPNRDPFFHDVFSLYHGKPFDLGLYESGSARSVRFTKPGVSYIFCNIHPDMSAVVVALPTPYFALSARDGSFHIDHVPAGRYKLEVWYELASPIELASLTHEVEITSGDNVLPAITLHASDSHSDHLNKYGEPYPLDKGSKY